MKYGMWTILFGFSSFYSFLTLVGAVWGTWSTWSDCTSTCGYGVRTRERTCMYGECAGPEKMHATCISTDCGEGAHAKIWSNWGHWSDCTLTCGGGTRTRVRMCNMGDVTYCCEHNETSSCRLEYTQSRECINEDCYGTWSGWRQWGSCSVACGEGVHSRLRECEPTGSVCVGGGEQSRICYSQCPQSEKLIEDMDESKSCYNNNPCRHNGICATNGNHVTCICRGDWRGRACSHMCLYMDDKDACANKRGMFYDCANCNKFIVCTRTGNLISMSCTTDRMWNGNGCRLANETRIICLDTTKQ